MIAHETAPYLPTGSCYAISNRAPSLTLLENLLLPPQGGARVPATQLAKKSLYDGADTEEKQTHKRNKQTSLTAQLDVT